jgi:transposase
MPYSIVSDIWKKYGKTGSMRNLPRAGRPHKLRDPTKQLIIRTALKTRCAPFTEIANQVGGRVCEGTIQNILKEQGYHRRVACKVPYLTTSIRMLG